MINFVDITAEKIKNTRQISLKVLIIRTKYSQLVALDQKKQMHHLI